MASVEIRAIPAARGAAKRPLLWPRPCCAGVEAGDCAREDPGDGKLPSHV